MIRKYIGVFLEGYKGYAHYLWNEITKPSFNNYFYWLIAVSLFFFILEVLKPWRKDQSVFRKDFWLDLFYMFFNFFLFSLILYNALSSVVVVFLNDIIRSVIDFDLQAANPLRTWPMWAILLLGFVLRDFIQWWVHRMLHRVPRLWNFHKVHHSIEEMGFAGHLRFHWVETLVYRVIEYLPLALLGIGLYDFFVIHIFTLAWGHYNHSNFSIDKRITGGFVGLLVGIAIAFSFFDIKILDNPNIMMQSITILISTFVGAFVLGPLMRYIFNSPEMHIWHHSYELPKSHPYGMNYGMTLAIWDYIFGTAVIPANGRDIKIGYYGDEEMPEHFLEQAFFGFKKR